ncbi:MAG: glycosyltransferase [Bacteriovoracaceae bacterium]|nr:glycosyltransferase [Bacteriovoracaceae bacterium]
MEKLIKNSFVIIILLFIMAGLAFSFYLHFPSHWEQDNSWAILATKLMLYYLIFIFGRTLFLLSLSFIENMFNRKLKPVETFPLVTIIIPCHNEEVGIQKAIESIKKINYPNVEILVVDDGSSDKTFEIVRKLESKYSVRLIHQENAGKSQALNNGVYQALGDYFVCMDADSNLSENLLTDSIPYFEKDPNLAAVAGAVEVGNDNSIITKFQKLEYIVGLNFYKMAQSCLNLVTIVPGPIGVFSKKAVISIGGYHSDTFAEDCDLSMRLLMAGYNIKYNSKIKAKTEAPESFSSLITQRYRWSRGMTQAIFKSLRELSRHFSVRRFAIVFYMFLETILIPLINFSFVIITLQFALIYSIAELLGPFFIGLTILDMTLILYSIVAERELGALLILGVFNRLTYGLSLEVIRFFSILDEIFGLPMKWGTLVRKGMD